MSTPRIRAAFGGALAAAMIAAAGSASALEYKEAPALAALVKEGKLPPVAERVGEEPEVVKPHDSVGRYGGELRFGLVGSLDGNYILRMVGPQGLVRWNPTYTEIVPNVAKSYEIDPTGRVFTFHLRKGMKWSDGNPFTADDVMFNVEDIILNTDFAPTQPRYTSGGEPLKAEKIDDYTVRFTFKEPYGDFLAEIAGPLGQHPTLYAKHYCSQFMPKYNENIDKLIEENHASDWKNLFIQKCGDLESPSRWGNPQRPTLDPWIIKEPYVGAATRVVLERNPYFWQVDSEGNQLPYIDRVNAGIHQDTESLILDVIGGRIDFGLRHIGDPANRPVLAQNREKGKYRMFAGTPPGGNVMAIDLNLTHKNPEMRKLFNEKDFRVALSIGMNRQEVIDTVLLGEGEPWQMGPFEDHPYFHEKEATQYLEYDPDQANKLLDGIGLDKRGPDGMRLLPSGKPLKFKIDVIAAQPAYIDMLQLIRRQWAEIGINMEVNPLERTFFYERTSNSNDHDAAVWGAASSWVPGDIPQQIVPVHHDSRWGIAWRDWYISHGERGEEPPPTVKERFQLYDQARGTPDPVKRRELIMKIADIAAEQFEVIGVSKNMPRYGIAKDGLTNVPDKLVDTWYCATPSQVLPQTWYWQQ